MNPIFYSRLEKILERRKELLLKLSEKEVILPTAEEIIEINRIIMQEHKGIFGVRDSNILESAIGALLNKIQYEEQRDHIVLAGTLFTRLIKNHPFVDGNKRTAVVATEMFLEQNGAQLTLSNDRLYVLAIKVAKGELTEEEVAEELRGSPPRKGLSLGLRP